jgi:hypothetical protein
MILAMSVIILLAVDPTTTCCWYQVQRGDPRRNQDRHHPVDGGPGAVVTSAGLVRVHDDVDGGQRPH